MVDVPKFPLDEKHLDALLAHADAALKANNPLSLRIAGMCVLDFYQSTLRDALKCLGLRTSTASIQVELSTLSATVPGIDFDRFRGIDALRNILYHHTNQHPAPRMMENYLQDARTFRFDLLEAVEKVRQERSGMDKIPSLLLRRAEELEGYLHHFKLEDARKRVEALIHSAKTLASTTPLHDVERAFVLQESIGRELGSVALWVEMTGSEPEYEGPDEDYDPSGDEPDYQDYEPPDYSELYEPDPSEYDPSAYDPADHVPVDFEPSDHDPSDVDPGDYDPPNPEWEEGPADDEPPQDWLPEEDRDEPEEDGDEDPKE